MSNLRKTWSRRLRKAIAEELGLEPYDEALTKNEPFKRDFEECLSIVNSESIPAKPRHCTVRGKTCLVYTTHHEKIVDKVTASHLKRLLRLPSVNRNSIVNTLVALLPEIGPATIHRYDIKSFFESINRERAVTSIHANRDLDTITRRVIQKYHATCNSAEIQGLARGTALSSVLAEWALQELDNKMRQTVGVYFYARFVDDILIISADRGGSDPRDELMAFLEKQPHELKLNAQKTTIRTISGGKARGEASLSSPLEYLGYRFYSPDQGPFIGIDIADSKRRRIKSKIVKSYHRFLKNKNFAQLLAEIQFLAGNTVLVRRGLNPKAMLTGIYFNYPALTPEAYVGSGSLKDLDNFSRQVLTSTKSTLSKKLQAELTTDWRTKLLRCSFVAGHRKKICTGFSSKKARRLVEKWKHG